MMADIVQFLIANGCVKEDDLKNWLNLNEEEIFPKINRANKKLKPFNMMIRASMDEVTTIKYYVLISTVDNDITRAASHYTLKQFEFFKLILQAIINDPRGIITEEVIKSLAEKAKVSTTSKLRSNLPEYRVMFNEWCMKNWLLIVTEEDRDFITLGVRSVAELDVFMKQNLIEKPEDLNCKSCNNLSIYSVSCNLCDARFHKRCSKMAIDPEIGSCRGCPGRASSSSMRVTRT